MSVTVEIGVLRGFVLDDPVAGVLDNTEYTLGGEAFVDVSSRMVRMSSSRGKNRDLDKFQAGTLDVEFNNEDRFFDPLESTALDIVPRAPIRVSVDGERQFVGTINDWNYNYQTSGRSIVTTNASDDFVYLARQNVPASGSVPEQSTGARVAEVLDSLTVDWPADKRDIDTGDNTVVADTFEGENALEYLQLVNASEQGQLFIAKDGDLQFRQRSDAAPRSDGLVTFADDGTGIPFVGAGINFDSEYIYNRAIITSPEGTATADDTLSQQTYGIVTYEEDTLAVLEQIDDIANYVVARYADPELRFQSITVNLDTLSAGHRANVLSLEIGDVCRVILTPNQTGSPIDRYGQIFRVEHSVDPSRHDVRFQFDPLEFAPFVLDDAVFGKLDTGHLGF